MSQSGDIQAVTFGLGSESFAIPVAHVQEILDFQEVFHIPGGPDYLLGLMQLRGHGITTIDFRLRMGLPAIERTPATRVLVVDVPIADRHLLLGLVVDRVVDVRSFAAEQIEPAPDIGVAWRSDYITGVVQNEAEFVVLMNVQAIFSAEDAAQWSADEAA